MDETTPDASADEVMDVLAWHLPITLLMDLTPPTGPHSREVPDAEGLPDDPWWDAA